MADLDFRPILHALADAVIAVDQAQCIVYVNAAAEALLGWPPDELVGQPLITIIPPRLRAVHQAGFTRYMTTRVPKIMGRALRVPALRHDGGEVEVDLVLAALHLEGGDDLIVGSLRDLRQHVELERQITVTGYLRAATKAAATITARLDLEHVLHTAVETMVSHLDAALARIWLYDAATNTLQLRASAGLTSATEQSSRARLDVATYPYKVGVVARTLTPFIKNGLAGDPQFDQEWVAREGLAAVVVLPLLMTGELRGVLVYFSRQPLSDDLADVLTTFATMVTTSLNHVQVFAREQAARAEAEQAQRGLAILAEANARLLREAQEAIGQRDDFISTATHDLKNPLVSIKGLAQILLRRATGDGSPDMERIVEGLGNIDNAATRMTALINELLDVTHLQAGQPLALERSATDLVALARQAAAQYQQATERHRIRVETALDELVGAVDAARMERALGNLLSNAVKFSPDGGEITVTVAREPLTPNPPRPQGARGSQGTTAASPLSRAQTEGVRASLSQAPRRMRILSRAQGAGTHPTGRGVRAGPSCRYAIRGWVSPRRIWRSSLSGGIAPATWPGASPARASGWRACGRSWSNTAARSPCGAGPAPARLLRCAYH